MFVVLSSGIRSKRGLDYMYTYEYYTTIFPVQSNQLITSCLDVMGVSFKGFMIHVFVL